MYDFVILEIFCNINHFNSYIKIRQTETKMNKRSYKKKPKCKIKNEMKREIENKRNWLLVPSVDESGELQH